MIVAVVASKICRQPLLAAFVALVLVGCGGDSGSDRAEVSLPVVMPSSQAPSSNAGLLSVKGTTFEGLKQVMFRIKAKAGGGAKPVEVTYTLAYLKRRARISPDGQHVQVPVFGLYAGRINSVTLTLQFDDGSSRSFETSITTPPLAASQALYARPSVRKAKSPGEELPYDYFFLKAGTGAPVVIDTDAEVRWTSIDDIPSSFSTLFSDGVFYIGDQSQLMLRRLYLDGGVDALPMADAELTNFHHSLELGKTGFLGEFDAKRNSIRIVESILAEVDRTGRVIKTWDMGQILRDYMRANGDAPVDFVRDGVDWFHMNSAIYDRRDDSLIVSSRENFVIKIDYSSGAIKWILGDPTKYWAEFPSLRSKSLILAPGGWAPIGQHALSLNAAGHLMLFNNGAGSFQQPSGAPAGETRLSSAVSTYSIDELARSAVEVSRFDYSNSVYSRVCSSAYEGGKDALLISYAMADGMTKARLVGVGADRRVVFDFEYPANNCQTSWNAQPISFEALVLD